MIPHRSHRNLSIPSTRRFWGAALLLRFVTRLLGRGPFIFGSMDDP
jgi:hypothetical protein